MWESIGKTKFLESFFRTDQIAQRDSANFVKFESWTVKLFLKKFLPQTTSLPKVI